uniref:Ig-like domain-containing protein n=1 Tax=Gopherus agassizii TaxID=38772 RepID=A0A452GSF8_9SAUR
VLRKLCCLVSGKSKKGQVCVFPSRVNSPVSGPPKLKELKNQESAVGQKLVLRCEANSEYPALRFKWLKNGKEITKKTKPENVKISKKQKKYSELHISKASLADAGEYTCKVSNKLGNDSTRASITITDTNGKMWLFVYCSLKVLTLKEPSGQKGLQVNENFASIERGASSLDHTGSKIEMKTLKSIVKLFGCGKCSEAPSGNTCAHYAGTSFYLENLPISVRHGSPLLACMLFIPYLNA